MRTHVTFLALAIVGLAHGCSPQAPVGGIKSSGQLTLYEGLPHQLYEAETLEQEKKKPTVDLGGFPFYQEPLELKASDRESLRDLLGNPSSLKAFSGEKKCGGFHPDYAVEWTEKGRAYRYLICFGCGEARVISPDGDRRYDLEANVRQRLRDLLQPYRKNRPSTGQSGP